MVFNLKKKESNYWKRLTKEEKKKYAHIQVDWTKWVDEDEEEEEG